MKSVSLSGIKHGDVAADNIVKCDRRCGGANIVVYADHLEIILKPDIDSILRYRALPDDQEEMPEGETDTEISEKSIEAVAL